MLGPQQASAQYHIYGGYSYANGSHRSHLDQHCTVQPQPYISNYGAEYNS